MEILTVTELAALLKMSKAQVYELTKEPTRSGAMRNNPIPFLKTNRTFVSEKLILMVRKAGRGEDRVTETITRPVGFKQPFSQSTRRCLRGTTDHRFLSPAAKPDWHNRVGAFRMGDGYGW
jgi:hypothetical protein